MNDTFKIKTIEGSDTTVEFNYHGEKFTHTLANVPIHDPAELNAHLKRYADAYIRGLEIERASAPHADVTASIGKTQPLS